MVTKKRIVAAKRDNKRTRRPSTTKRVSGAKRATRRAKTASKKAAKATVKAPVVPHITTEEGLKELQHHCEGIMDMIGEYLLVQNPKISDKRFKSEAHDIVRMLFGMSPR
jgi:hypothetical protein